MKYEPISINPAIVTWARYRAGFSIDDARQSFAGIPDWESGEVSPSYPQLEQMAEKFKVPIAVFFFPEPPDLPPVSESFRTLSEADFNQLPRQVETGCECQPDKLTMSLKVKRTAGQTYLRF